MFYDILAICVENELVFKFRNFGKKTLNVSSVPSPMGEEVTSEAGEVRSFVGWNFFQLKCIISLSTWTQ